MTKNKNSKYEAFGKATNQNISYIAVLLTHLEI